MLDRDKVGVAVEIGESCLLFATKLRRPGRERVATCLEGEGNLGAKQGGSRREL